MAAASSVFPVSVPSVPAETVLFANFDNGGEGVAFHDIDKRNKGGDYRRSNSGVDIQRNTDIHATDLNGAPGVGRSLGNVQPGEWLNYTINVTTSGSYDFQIRLASATGGSAHINVDGVNVSGPIDLASTGGWDQWTTVEKAGINLAAGKHVLTFVVDSSTYGGDVGDLSWFRFNPSFQGTGGDAASLDWPSDWTRVADAPEARFEAMSHTLNGKLYVFGGFVNGKYEVSREYSVYDADNNTWKTLGTLPGGMAETHATPVDDGKYIYFVGGFAGDLGMYDTGATQRASNRVYRYNPTANKWTLLTLTPEPQGAGGTAIVGRELHFFGGNPDDRVTNIDNHYVLNLDDVSAGWTTAAPMPDAKDHFSTVVLDNKIYSLGGEYGHDVELNTQRSVHVYDPARDTWTRLADLPIANGHAEGSTFVYDGRILFAGGQTQSDDATNRVFSYDVSRNRWSEVNRLPYYLQGASVTVIGSKVIVTLGARYTESALAWTFVGDL
jgi:N-acetylneuraminic acid mutarotase